MTKSWKDSLNGKSKFIKEKVITLLVFVVDIWSKPEMQSVTKLRSVYLTEMICSRQPAFSMFYSLTKTKPFLPIRLRNVVPMLKLPVGNQEQAIYG